MRFGYRLSSSQLTDTHVFASGFHLILYLRYDDGDAFRYFLGDVVSVSEHLEYDACGQGNMIERRGKGRGIDRALGVTEGKACV